jgi:methyl-accepting chemotaxis protein
MPSDETQVIDGLFFQHDLLIAFSMRPILDSEELSEPRGYLVFGRSLDQFFVEKFGEQLKKEFKIEVVTKNPSSMSDFTTNNYGIGLLSDGILKTSKSYLDGGNTVFRISTKFQRVITQSGQNSLEYALFSSLAIGVIMIIAVLLKKSVFVLLSNLTRQMQGVSKGKDYTSRAAISSGDEIGVLSSEFNNMLTVIEKNNDELVEANNQIKAANSKLEALSLTYSLTQITNRLGLVRKLKMEWTVLYRKQSHLAIIMIDIDYFKLFNDHYGYLEGDKCLL